MEEQYEDLVARERRQKRMAEMRRRKRQQALFRKYFLAGVIVLCVVIAVLIISISRSISAKRAAREAEEVKTSESVTTADVQAPITVGELSEASPAIVPEETEPAKVYEALKTADTDGVSDEVISSNVIFIDVGSGEVLAQREMNQIIDPASMTKIMTVLVAAEQIEEDDLTDKVPITIDITDYAYSNDCSAVGFSENERVTVEDLFYGTILPSGADAALALAVYAAGSQDAFVELMNEKLEELGLSDTAHFTNCVGLYDEEHYCTVYDMAMILEAAVDDPFCRKVLSEHTYTTSATSEHPEGITISNWFLRRIEDKETGAEIVCGKTGYVVQSGNCAASYGEDADGNGYICVTADSTSAWRCIYDHVAMYSKYTE